MQFTKTNIDGVIVVELDRIEDERGFFARTYCNEEFSKIGIDLTWAQANMSFTKTTGTFRGFHFQDQAHAELKFIRCTKGAIWDIAVNLDTTSSNYLQHFAIELNEDNHKALIVPAHCAHGFLTLRDLSLIHI